MSTLKFNLTVVAIIVLGSVVGLRATKNFSFFEKAQTKELSIEKVSELETIDSPDTEDDLFSLIADALVEEANMSKAYKEENDLTDPFGTDRKKSDNVLISSKHYYRQAKVESVISANSFIASIDGISKVVRLIGVKDSDDIVHLESLISGTDSVYLEFDLERYNREGEALCYVWLDPPNLEVIDMMVNNLLLLEGVSEIERLTSPNLKYNRIFASSYKLGNKKTWISPRFFYLQLNY